MDCYYHGYSGSPGGTCTDCDRENRQGLAPGSLPSTQTGTMEDANRNSIGPERYKKEQERLKNKQ